MIFLLLACSAQPNRLTVLAASSLTEGFSELEQQFEEAHRGVDVQLSFAGSQTLATQVLHGIDADVFASADPVQVQRLAGSGLGGPAREFLWNELVLVGPDVVSVPQLAGVGSLVVGSPQSPVGRYTDAFLVAAERELGPRWRASVDRHIVSREPNVRAVITKVVLGEADAALVYRTDARSGALRVVGLGDLAPIPSYVQVRLGDSPLAGEWMELVESSPAVFERYGFRVVQP